MKIKKGYHGLVCLNSLSYMAGSMNVWDTNTIGCKETHTNTNNFKKQEINDG